MRPLDPSRLLDFSTRDAGPAEPIRRVSLRPYAWRISTVVVLLIGLAGVNMAVPFAMKLIFDRVLPGQDHAARWSLVWPILAGIAVAYLLRNALYFSSRMLSVSVAEHLVFRVRSALFGRLQHMRLEPGGAEQVGQLSSCVMDGAGRLQQFIEEHLPKMLFNAISFSALDSAASSRNSFATP